MNDLPESGGEVLVPPLAGKCIEYTTFDYLVVSLVDSITISTLVVYHVLEDDECGLPDLDVIVIIVGNDHEISGETLIGPRSLYFALARLEQGGVESTAE